MKSRCVLAALCASAVLLCACGETAQVPELLEPVRANYDTATVERRTLCRQTVYEAYVCAETDELQFAAAGTVAKLYVAPGSTVTAGQLLCELDTKAVDAAIESAEKALASAQETYNYSRTQLLLSVEEQEARKAQASGGRTKAQLEAEKAALTAEDAAAKLEISALEKSVAQREEEIRTLQGTEQTEENLQRISELTGLLETETLQLTNLRGEAEKRTSEISALAQTLYDVEQYEITIEGLWADVNYLDSGFRLQSQSAQENLEKLEKTREESFLSAPSDGVVGSMAVSQAGDSVAADSTVIWISHPDRLYLRYDGSQNLATVKTPATAMICGVETELERIAYTTAELRRFTAEGETAHARYKILNPEVNAKAGDYAQLRLCSQERTDVLCVPVNALCKLDDDGNGYVFLEKDGEKVYTPVTYGMVTDAWAEITEGLSEGDVVYVQ